MAREVEDVVADLRKLFAAGSTPSERCRVVALEAADMLAVMDRKFRTQGEYIARRYSQTRGAIETLRDVLAAFEAELDRPAL